MKKLNKKTAFTLAEVLITLAIIGVVAAMTIPTLVQNYNERVTVTKVKKTYSMLTQAFKLAMYENGTVDMWGLNYSRTVTDEGVIRDYTSPAKVLNIFSQYIKGTPFIEADDDSKEYNLQGVSLSVADGVVNYVPVEKTQPTSTRLNDGTILRFDSTFRPCLMNDKICTSITMYIPDKTNKMIQGKNLFTFYIGKDSISPAGFNGDENTPFNNTCNISINNRTSGRGCTAWIIENGNMDYLKCNDLEWGKKTKCN